MLTLQIRVADFVFRGNSAAKVALCALEANQLYLVVDEFLVATPLSEHSYRVRIADIEQRVWLACEARLAAAWYNADDRTFSVVSA